MARDYVTIANLATGFLGEDDQIRAPDEDSKPARAIAAVWDEIRRVVLSKGEWDFAIRTVKLSPRVATVTEPVIGYANAFRLPSDFRRFVALVEPAWLADDYRVQGGELLIDATEITLRYVRDVIEPALWSDGFVEAFAMRLAWQLADRLTGDKQRKQQALDAYLTALRQAKGTDAKQNPPRRHPESEWARGRRIGEGYWLRQGRHP